MQNYNHEPPIYSDQFIAFLDILGYKEQLKSSTAPSDLLITHSLLHKDPEINEFIDNGNIYIYVFSDSIYIAASLKACYAFLSLISIIYANILKQGFLLRGGISYGKIYATSNYVIGPALLEAYELEAQVAIYPRILISPQVLDKLKATKTNSQEYIFSKDFDGLYYLNALYIRSLSYNIQRGVLDIFDNQDFIHTFISNCKKYQNIPQIIAKYNWLYNYMQSLKIPAEVPTFNGNMPSLPEVVKTFQDTLKTHYDEI